MNYKLILLAGFVVILAVGFGSAYLLLNVPGVTSSIHPSVSTVSTSTSSAPSSLYFLTLTQKGIAMVINPSSAQSFLGFQRVVNISLNTPAQVYYWEEIPYGDMVSLNQYVFLPLNNGTVEIFNSTNMKVVDTLTVGHSIGFIGVAYSPHMNYIAIADGPSGVVEVINVHTLQKVWSETFTMNNGKTMYPCDVRWTPDGKYLLVPMKLNDSIVILNSTNGKVVTVKVTSQGSEPYMLSLNPEGTMVAAEFVGNNSVGFYSLPSLSLMSMVRMPSTVVAQRGTFTPNGSYYLEASADSNEVAVISTSSFSLVKVISLPSTSAPGLSDIVITPDGQYAYTVIHGNVKTGGMIVLISLSSLSVSTQVPLTTAPSIVLPMTGNAESYLVDNVLLPPVTGLHC
jgi:DNA-binding beta-propeller fold protein YncE